MFPPGSAVPRADPADTPRPGCRRLNLSVRPEIRRDDPDVGPPLSGRGPILDALTSDRDGGQPRRRAPIPAGAACRAKRSILRRGRHIGDSYSPCLGSAGQPERRIEIRLADFSAPELNERGVPEVDCGEQWFLDGPPTEDGRVGHRINKNARMHGEARQVQGPSLREGGGRSKLCSGSGMPKPEMAEAHPNA
jgi:hypothetical protein